MAGYRIAVDVAEQTKLFSKRKVLNDVRCDQETRSIRRRVAHVFRLDEVGSMKFSVHSDSATDMVKTAGSYNAKCLSLLMTTIYLKVKRIEGWSIRIYFKSVKGRHRQGALINSRFHCYSLRSLLI